MRNVKRNASEPFGAHGDDEQDQIDGGTVWRSTSRHLRYGEPPDSCLAANDAMVEIRRMR